MKALKLLPLQNYLFTFILSIPLFSPIDPAEDSSPLSVTSSDLSDTLATSDSLLSVSISPRFLFISARSSESVKCQVTSIS